MVPLKVHAFQGTSEGSSTEVCTLGQALCRFNSSYEKSALAAKPEVIRSPALDL